MTTEGMRFAALSSLAAVAAGVRAGGRARGCQATETVK